MLCRPEELDWELFQQTFQSWLGRNYSRKHYVEWSYLHIRPRILVEELLRGADGNVPPDYKFFVFHGRAHLVQINSGRFAEFRVNLYRPDWTPVDADWLDGELRHPRAPPAPAPAALSRMIEIAEALGQGTDFVRVDLYDLDGRIIFGELTNSPAAANARFEPHAFDLEVGSWWTLPQGYHHSNHTNR